MGEAKRRRDAGEDWTQRPEYALKRAGALRSQEWSEKTRIRHEREHGAANRREILELCAPRVLILDRKGGA
jgi:hypothetical protein